ncbi:MAG: TrbI/VirB10 family protein [Acidobacteriota bacterium]
MRRLITVLGALFLVAPLWAASGETALAHRIQITHRPAVNSQNSAALTVPAETMVKARLISGMHTLVSHVNDPVSAQMTEPVYINGRLALPAGTLFDGHITSIRHPKRMRHNGKICFRFDHVTLPNGQEVPVSAVITRLEKSKGLRGKLDSEGYIEGHKRTSWKSFLAGAIGVGGLTAAKVAVASSAALTVAAPASAAAFVGYELFLRRGNNVNVPPMTRCHIRLISSLTIPALG